jgi:membrane protein implicated in regulation of membrane protease activity
MWWSNLTDYQQVLFVVAVSATMIMVLFIVLMLIGFDNSEFDGIDDIDTDFDIDSVNDEPLSDIVGLKVFTIRGTLAFISIGSWVTMLFVDIVEQTWLATLIGAIAGFIAAYLLAFALRQAMKLESSGNLDYRKAIGKTATVYLRVPKLKSGKGKVNLIIDGRYSEIDAMTDEEEDLNVNQDVKVVEVYNDTILIVKKTIKE